MSRKWRRGRPLRTLLGAALLAMAALVLAGGPAHAATAADVAGNVMETAVPAGVIGLLFVTAGALALWRRR